MNPFSFSSWRWGDVCSPLLLWHCSQLPSSITDYQEWPCNDICQLPQHSLVHLIKTRNGLNSRWILAFSPVFLCAQTVSLLLPCHPPLLHPLHALLCAWVLPWSLCSSMHASWYVFFFFFSFCNETSTEQNFVETSYKANTNPEADSCTTGHCPISCWFLVPGASHFNVRDVHVISIFLMLLLGCMNVLSPFHLHICWKVSNWSKIQPAFPQNHDSLALLPNIVAHMSGNSNTANQMLSKVRARLFSSPVSELVEQWMVSIFWFPASGI